MSSLSQATCPAPFPTSSTTTAVTTAVCPCTSSSSSGTDYTTVTPSHTLSTSTSTETSTTTLTSTSTTGTAVVPSTTSPSSSPANSLDPSCPPPDNQEPSTTDTVELPSTLTSTVSTTSLTTSSSSEPCPCSTTISSPTPRPPVGDGDPPESTSSGSTTVSTSPHPSTSAESPETDTTSNSLTTTSSTVASSPPIQAPPTATQDTSSTITSTDTVPGSTTTSTGPTRPPPNNGPEPPETSVTTRDRPSTYPDTSTGMSSPRPTSTTTTRRPPPSDAETPVGDPEPTTTSPDAPPTSTSTTSRPPATPPPPPGSTTSRSTTPPPPPPTSTTTTPPPADTDSETVLPPTDPTTRASSTITSVTTVRQESGVRQTTSTTVTMAPISTFETPVEVLITDTEDGSVSTTIPPFLTITSTWTQADGSLATETHIVANPPGSPLETEHRGILSRTGATAGIFAAVGVIVSAGLFAAYLLWRRRRQANLRRQWIQGMSQQRPDSLGGTYPFGHHPDSPSMGGGGNVAAGGIGFGHTRNQSGSRVAPPTPPPGMGSDSRDALPWDESRRIPAQRAEMRQRPTATGVVQDATLAGVGTVKYHGRGLSGEQTGVLVRTHSQTHRDEGPAPPPSSYDLRADNGNTGSTNKNPFAGGILGLKRTGSGSTTDSSTTSTWLNRSTPGTLGHGKGKMSISKERISLPVPPPIPSPIRKPAALYDPDELFSNRLPNNATTQPAATNSAAKQGAPPSPPAGSPTSSNWYQRQSMDYGPSPAPSTPSMYPPTLPADDEMDESEGFDSDATFDRLMQKPVVTEATTSNAEPPKSTYGDVNGYGAFQNLFVVPSRPKPPPPPPPRSANRVPPLSIDTAVSTLSNRGSSSSGPGSASATTSPVPPRPPRSILRTSNGSLSLGPGPAPAKVRVQSTPEVFPLTPPASTPGHSPHSSYTLPGSPSAILGAAKSGGTDPMVQEKVQSILSGRRLMLDRKVNERGGSGSD